MVKLKMARVLAMVELSHLNLCCLASELIKIGFVGTSQLRRSGFTEGERSSAPASFNLCVL
jgi:hypothetical protein